MLDAKPRVLIAKPAARAGDKGEGPGLAGEIVLSREKVAPIPWPGSSNTGLSQIWRWRRADWTRFTHRQSSQLSVSSQETSGRKREQRKAGKESHLRGENPRGPARLANRAVMNLFVNAQAKIDRAERGERGVKRQAVPARTGQKRNSWILEEQDVRAGEWTCAKARPPVIPKPKEERNRRKDSEAGAGARLGKHHQDVADERSPTQAQRSELRLDALDALTNTLSGWRSRSLRRSARSSAMRKTKTNV